MTQPIIRMYTTLDLTPPKAAEESREVVLHRCLEAIGIIRSAMQPLFDDPKTRAQIVTFLDDMTLYFEPKLPPELDTLLREWNAMSDGPAA